jgi:hypothetical protein
MASWTIRYLENEEWQDFPTRFTLEAKAREVAAVMRDSGHLEVEILPSNEEHNDPPIAPPDFKPGIVQRLATWEEAYRYRHGLKK